MHGKRFPAILLIRLARAIAVGEHIHAVIRATSIYHDGKTVAGEIDGLVHSRVEKAIVGEFVTDKDIAHRIDDGLQRDQLARVL